MGVCVCGYLCVCMCVCVCVQGCVYKFLSVHVYVCCVQAIVKLNSFFEGHVLVIYEVITFVYSLFRHNVSLGMHSYM